MHKDIHNHRREDTIKVHFKETADFVFLQWITLHRQSEFCSIYHATLSSDGHTYDIYPPSEISFIQ